MSSRNLLDWWGLKKHVKIETVTTVYSQCPALKYSCVRSLLAYFLRTEAVLSTCVNFEPFEKGSILILPRTSFHRFASYQFRFILPFDWLPIGLLLEFADGFFRARFLF